MTVASWRTASASELGLPQKGASIAQSPLVGGFRRTTWELRISSCCLYKCRLAHLLLRRVSALSLPVNEWHWILLHWEPARPCQRFGGVCRREAHAQHGNVSDQ